MRLKSTRIVAALAVTGALAGGGAAVASAATGGSSTTTSSSVTTTTSTAKSSPSTTAKHSGTHHCPNSTGSSGSGASYGPGPNHVMGA